jgi:hypothetical protein
LALALPDQDLARWSLDQLRAPETGEVVIVPGINRLVTYSAALCHAALDEPAAALKWLSDARAEASRLEMPIELARIDLATSIVAGSRPRPIPDERGREAPA